MYLKLALLIATIIYFVVYIYQLNSLLASIQG